MSEFRKACKTDILVAAIGYLLKIGWIIIIVIIHEFHGDTSLKQKFRAAVNVTY